MEATSVGGSARPESGPPLDPKTLAGLRELTEDDPAVLRELIELFLHDTPDMLRTMRSAIERGDSGALRLAAHSCKGSGSNLGASGLAHLSGEMEQLAPQLGTPAGTETAHRLLARMEAEYERAAEALQALKI